MNILKHITVFGVAMVAAISVSAATITGEDVLKMHRAGISDDVVIQTIESSGSTFHLSQQDVEALKREGVSQRVITVMQKKRLVLPAPPQAVAPTNDENAAAAPAPPKEQPNATAPEVVRATPVYPVPAAPYYYPPPPVTYYYGPGYYYDPWYPPVYFSFGYYGGHGGYHGYHGGHGGHGHH